VALGGDLAAMDTGTAWVTITAYTMQLYFDFSGYSDMAIGLGKIMGFHFPENFDNPYNSASVSEFWRRWHITLGTFMRNYLYIPLGGNRCSKPRMYFNLWVVFLLSGLWHGASWNFVIWGAYHGFWLVLERIGLGKVYEKMGKIPSVIITFLIVTIGWAIFRIENLSDAFTFISRLFAFDFQSIAPINSLHFYAVLIFYTEYSKKQHLTIWLVSVLLFIFCLGALNASGFSPFIYFRF
jgi:alginate O-acetyltransferase complex protein AlgI